ncbi:MAG: alkaline phosphatase family protein [Rhodospirillaceae bacterium]|jgi:arylsulfatase A-like enzyme|nr:alkaline phosphatase family protein [Rhodospirillaceae bacterium]MBT5938748.1 alkaline phosphatase family protein [Rhodospirillaceae bacterium]MBT7268396.1 alkaline phosphatase family protein [Rhodospirillaceae bacterium]
MGQVKNILFIMCDQLRWDYLGCYGHPTLQTPHIDRLAAAGMTFDKAFVQSAICGPSRMSFYTGRYMSSHGATMNGVALPISNLTLGDYLQPLGVPSYLIGKSHVTPDIQGMQRLGLHAGEGRWEIISEGGFDAIERDDGMHLDANVDPDLAYNAYLAAKGYKGKNPWHNWANSAEGPEGEILSGWKMGNAIMPARIKEADSETPYMTRRAIEFIKQQDQEPWCLHLSYIKPHWPYMAPAPYHARYSADDCLPPRCDAAERDSAHPLHQGYMTHPESIIFSDAEKRQKIVPTYMGLIKQIDDQIGVLLDYLEESDLMDKTMIVFTSDHGDQMGDHWLGEKELFFEESVRIPLIIYDPAEAADSMRGKRESRLVEAIDLVPTFVDVLGGEIPDHILEGRSLTPLLRGDAPRDWRDFVVSELNYAYTWCRRDLGLKPDDAKAIMLRTEKWKYIHHNCFSPQLFNLTDDPDEFHDLGSDPEYQLVVSEMAEQMLKWHSDRKVRTTLSEQAIEDRTAAFWDRGVQLGQW